MSWKTAINPIVPLIKQLSAYAARLNISTMLVFGQFLCKIWCMFPVISDSLASK